MRTIEDYIIPGQTYTNLQEVIISRKELRALSFFWGGFVLYTAAFALYFTANGKGLYRVEAIGLLVMLFSAMGAVQVKIENNYLKAIYVLYCGWLLTVIARGFSFNYDFLYNSFFDAWYGILPYFVPIVLLFPKNVFYLKKVFTAISVLGVVFIIYSVMFRGQLGDLDNNVKSQDLMEIFSKTLAVPCGFLVITYVYHSKKRKLLAFSVIALCLLLALIRARRAISFMNITYLVCFYLMYLYANRIRFSTFLFSIFVIALIAFGGFQIYTANKHGAFNLITNRIDEDTRTTVEECFYDDLTTKEWIVGKGMRGTYFCPQVDESSDDYTGGYRTMIETDYLNIILKGGVISIGLLLLIALPAVFNGLFRSKNMLSKGCAIWILLWLIDLYPATVNTFTLNYLLVWISIGICYSKTIRYMAEKDVKELLTEKSKTFTLAK